MNLYLKGSFLNGTYSNEHGQVLFKVKTPLGVSVRTATVTRVVPNDEHPKNGQDLVDDFRDRYAELGEIEFRVLGSSLIRIEGTQVEAQKYFRKVGWFKR